jgi:restriction endonuclease S subunit
VIARLDRELQETRAEQEAKQGVIDRLLTDIARKDQELSHINQELEARGKEAAALKANLAEQQERLMRPGDIDLC